MFTEALSDRLEHFFGSACPQRISRSLRKVFFDYLRMQHAGLDIEFDYILDDIENLIELMEFASEELKQKPTSA